MLPLSAAPVFAESPATVPAHFRDELVWDGLTSPTAVAFAPNGRVFVSQKNGRINVYDSLTDSTATQFIDLTSDVMNYWDRGMVGLVVDPDFPTRPYVYVAYTYDHILGDPAPAPKWGIGQPSDPCPTPPGGNTDGCVVSGRVERLTVSSNGAGSSVSSRKVLVTDWCQQFPSHTVGTLAFGPEGALYVSGGDGASFDEGDWGQFGGTLPGTPTPVNPCDDPTDEGGAVRSQDYRTNGDPMGLDGTIIRIDPDTGAAWPDNANAGNADANKARTIAYGLRNPFRITIRPSNGHLWIADVGWSAYEEIDRITDPDAAPKNFGWPCLEGNEARPQYENVPLCQSLSSSTAPMWEYWHESEIVNGDGCTPGSSSITGITFLKSNSNYPSRYDDGLFFTDWNRGCIWFVPDAGGNPDFAAVEKFADLRRDSEDDGGAVWLGMTPAGDLIYADFNRGEIRAIRYYPVNAKPNATFTATPSYGALPLVVKFDASGSTDPDGDALTYAWDLDGDGLYDDSTAKKPSRTYSSVASIVVRLRVTDDGVPSEFDTASKTIFAGSWAPIISMTKPKTTVTWEQGTVIPFAATATDEDGSIGASGFRWVFSVSHCPSNCHLHEVQSFDGVKSGSFVAPYHEAPSSIVVELTVTDSDGLKTVKKRTLAQKLPFTDIANSKFVEDIVWLEAQGITSGCTATKFCPNDPVSRGQMASFLARAFDLPAASKNYFTDDNNNKHEKNINRLAKAGITNGCTATRFCPNDNVSRGQMASFLARAFDLPAASKNYFTDDNNNKHEKNINRLAKAGITKGCTPTRFCPNDVVTRGQMAAFLHRAFGD